MTAGARLELLADELSRGRVYECAIRHPDLQVHGLAIADGQPVAAIYIDPRLSVLEVVLHELLHRRYPAWREGRVRREAERLVMSMDESQKRTWWRRYRKARTISVPLDHEG